MPIKWPLFTLKKHPQATLTGLYIAPNAGATMQSLTHTHAIADKGLTGDRYCNKTGYWDPVEGCQVTLITEHDLKLAKRGTDLAFNNGQHRRNLVIEGIKSTALKGKLFQIGEAIFRYDKPRPPCGYLNNIEGRGMAKALSYNSGICIQVIRGGKLCIGDSLIILEQT